MSFTAVLGGWAAVLGIVSARGAWLALRRGAGAPLAGPDAGPRAARSSGEHRGLRESVVLLRPCCGAEPELEACLRSAAGAFPGSSVRHLVEDAWDAAWSVARTEARALEALGLDAAAIVTGASAPNRKADQLARATRALDADVLLCADSDVLLDEAVVAELLSAVHRPGVGLAWAPPVEVARSRTLGDRASQAVLAGSLHAFPLLARLDPPGVVGKLFAVRCEALRAAGGFEALLGVLGEDVELGRNLRQARFAVVATRRPARSLASGRSVVDVVRRFARWIQVVRSQRPALLPSYPLLFCATAPLVAASAWLASAGGGWPALLPGLFAILVRLGVAAAARRAGGSPVTLGGMLADAVLADTVLTVAFVSALASRGVRWRGRSLQLRGRRLTAS